MKNIFLVLLTILSNFAWSQTKYASLADACSRNTSNITTNNSRAIYINNVAINEYAFTDNRSDNFKRLPRGYYYHVASKTAIQTNVRGKIINTQTCVQGTTGGNFTIQDTYAKGLSGDSNYETDKEGNGWYFAPSNEFWSQMSVEVLSNNKINVKSDTRGWGSGSGTLKYKLDVSPRWYTESEIESIDFSNQKGRDISVIGALFDGNGYIMDSKQSFVHFAGDANSDVPSFFKRPANKRIGSPSYFPNFSAPVGKKNIINYGSLAANGDWENHQYLSKGFNYLTKKGNPAVPLSVSMYSEYDTWATDNGCPPAHGVNRQAEAAQWLAGKSIRDLYQYYLPVINTGSQYGVMFHDFEAFGYVLLGNQTACNKLASLHREFKINNPNCLMTSYINARPIEINYGPDISNAQVAVENNKYNLPFSSLASGFYAKPVQYYDLNTGNLTGETGYMSDNIGLGIVGDYLHRYNDNNFYAFIQEMELAKKHLPNKPIVSLFWSYIETLPGQDARDINSVRNYYKKSNGFVYQNDYKPAVPFSEMYNRSIWSNFVADGQWLWHDPHNSTDGYDYHGGNAKDIATGEYIKDDAPNQFYSFATLGSMEISTTVGYDYSQLALYELSLNNDILPNQTLNCDFSIDGGLNYFTGEDLKPASSEYKKIPIVRYKTNGNSYLVLAYNKFLESHQTQTIKVRINGKTVDIKLNGQFSTLKRIN